MFLLALGATARLTRLINADVIGGPIRAAGIRLSRRGDDGWLPYLLRCPWCLSMWIGGAVYATAWFYGHTGAWWITCAALSASYLIGVTADLLDPEE